MIVLSCPRCGGRMKLESMFGFDSSFTDLGDNQCRCGDASEPCRILSSNVVPPPLQ